MGDGSEDLSAGIVQVLQLVRVWEAPHDPRKGMIRWPKCDLLVGRLQQLLLLLGDPAHLGDAVSQVGRIEVLLDLEDRQDVLDGPNPFVRLGDLVASVPHDQHGVSLLAVLAIHTDNEAVEELQAQSLRDGALHQLACQAFVHVAYGRAMFDLLLGEDCSLFRLELLEELCERSDHQRAICHQETPDKCRFSWALEDAL